MQPVRIFPDVRFDPGTRATGWVGADGKTLLRVGLLRPDKIDISKTCPGASRSIMFEMPVLYPGPTQKARPKDILKLAQFAGQLAGVSLALGGGKACVSSLEPRQWKGQVPDAILYGRIIEALTSAEHHLVNRCLDDVPTGLAHNVLDAVGIWMHSIARSF